MGDWFWDNISMAKSQSSISMLILSNIIGELFLVSRKIVIRYWHFLQTNKTSIMYVFFHETI